MKVAIEREILEKLPHFNVVAYSMDVKLKDSAIIEDEIKKYESMIKEEYSLEEVLNIPLIKEARDSYKALGKDPSRYRLAVESLYRRLVKGYGLYRINNLVDAGNILSIKLARSTAILDYEKIVGDVHIRLGKESDLYFGIGRGQINVSNIPVYVDSVGPFGSTTSDTERTMIRPTTKKILVFVICFSESEIDKDKKETIDIFKKYANAKNISELEVIKR